MHSKCCITETSEIRSSHYFLLKVNYKMWLHIQAKSNLVELLYYACLHSFMITGLVTKSHVISGFDCVLFIYIVYINCQYMCVSMCM